MIFHFYLVEKDKMKRVGIIGAGNLGKHLHQMFKLNGFDYLTTISNSNKGVHVNTNLIEDSEIIFLTVKPNNVQTVCYEINNMNKWNDQKVIISAAAGVPAAKIKNWLGNNSSYKVIRCMPNLPVSVCSGSVVWYVPNNSGINDTKEILEYMFNGSQMIWIQNEELMDSATVAFGCLPAYISKFFNVYLDIGQEMGFSYNQTRSLLMASFSGTLELSKIYEPKDIIKQVASKGGATEKGLEMLDNSGFSENIKTSAFKSLERIKNITKSLD